MDSPINQVLKKLEHVHPNDNGYRACCPAHADSDPSLSITEAADGKVLLHCHAGCTPEEIVEAIGLSMADLFPRKHRKRKAAKPKPRLKIRRPDPQPLARSKNSPGAKEDWHAILSQHRASKAERATAGQMLGLSPKALRQVGVGFNSSTGTILFAERDGKGRVIGIVERDASGGKRSRKGSKRGLIIPESLKCDATTLLIVEGPTDTVAGCEMTLDTIGRPSATGGVEHLTTLLQQFSKHTEIIVVGENDKKGKTWVGRDAAQSVAAQLAEALDRPVHWSMPPTGAKDTRAFLVATRDKRPQQDSATIGRWLLQHLRDNAAIEYPKSDGSLRLIDTEAFLARTYKHDWMIPGLLVANQPCVLGGPKKCLKTSIAVDLVVSLVTGEPFLARFAVNRPYNVGLISGESGEATLQETVRRIVKRLPGGTARLTESPLYWGFSLPRLQDDESMEQLRSLIRTNRLEVIVIDPLYLCLLADNTELQAGNLYHMGPLLQKLSRACLVAGATPIMLHHTRKMTNTGFGSQKPKKMGPLDLDDLSQAGVAEFARQFILVNRRTSYELGSGHHELWMAVGGSAGHSALWAVDIDEGVITEEKRTRTWDVSVRSPSHIHDEARLAEAEKEEAKAAGDRQRILDVLEARPNGETVNAIAEVVHLGRPKVKGILENLLAEEIVTLVSIRKKAGPGKRKQTGYRLVASTSILRLNGHPKENRTTAG